MTRDYHHSLAPTTSCASQRGNATSSAGRRPRRVWLSLVVLMVLSTACAQPAADDRGATVREGIRIGSGQARPDFVLTDTSGRTFDFRKETDGYFTLLYFGYTNCPDVCPIHFANIAGGMAQLPDAVRARVKVVFVGVDPPRDTPERVRAWLDHFDRSFIGLVGTDVDLEKAQLAADVPPAEREEDLGGGRYSIAHAGWVLGYTANDEETWQFPLGVRQQSWASAIRRLATPGGKS